MYANISAIPFIQPAIGLGFGLDYAGISGHWHAVMQVTRHVVLDTMEVLGLGLGLEGQVLGLGRGLGGQVVGLASALEQRREALTNAGHENCIICLLNLAAARCQ